MPAAARRGTPAPAAASVPAEHGPLLDAFAIHLAGRSPHTRAAYLRDVTQLARLAQGTPLPDLATPSLRRFLAVLHARGLSGRSLARMLSSWRALYRFLMAQDPRRTDPSEGLKAPKAVKRLPSALSPDEAARLVALPADDAWQTRDRALLELAYSSGLRLAELAGLDLPRLDLETCEVRVWGKGAKERIVPVGQPAREALAAWIAARAPLAAPDEAALFIGRRGKRLTPRAIQLGLARWAHVQGLDRHVHPHMLRHSFASHVLQSSGDLRAVQEMLGHASIASTQVYTHLDFQYLAKVYDQAHPRAKRKPRAKSGT